MFDNLYQIEQAGRRHQQELLELQRQSETATTPKVRSTRRPSASYFRRLIVRFIHPRGAVAWLTRLLLVALALSIGLDARPAAAADATGSTGTHGAAVVQPLDAGSFSPANDPGTTGGHSPVVDPGSTGGHSPVIDAAAATGTTSPTTYLFWLAVVSALLIALSRGGRGASAAR